MITLNSGQSYNYPPTAGGVSIRATNGPLQMRFEFYDPNNQGNILQQDHVVLWNTGEVQQEHNPHSGGYSGAWAFRATNVGPGQAELTVI